MNSHPSDSDTSAATPESNPTPPAQPAPPAPPPPYAPQPPTASSASVDSFDKIRALGIVRPDEGRWFAGVAAGLAHRWGVDPLLVRGGFVALSLVFGIGLFVYGACWLLLPHPDGRIHAQEVTRGTVTAGFVGAVLATLVGLPFGNMWGNGPGWGGGTGLVSVVVIGVLIWWLARRKGAGPGIDTAASSHVGAAGAASGPAATGTTAAPGTPGTFGASASYEPPAGSWPGAGFGAQEPGPSTGAPVPAVTSPGAPVRQAPAVSTTHATRWATRPWRPLTLTTLGAAVLIGVLADQLAHNEAVTAAAALGVVGLGLLLAGLAGRRGGFLTPLALLLALSSVAATASLSESSTPDQVWRPTTAAQALDGFRTGGADTRIDLTSSELVAAARSGALEIPIDQGAGEVRLVLPAGVPARVEASVGAGEIRDLLRTRTEQGLGITQTVTAGVGSPVLTVKLTLGAGRVVIGESAISPATSPTPAPSGPASSGASPATPSSVPSPAVPSAPVPSRS